MSSLTLTASPFNTSIMYALEGIYITLIITLIALKLITIKLINNQSNIEVPLNQQNSKEETSFMLKDVIKVDHVPNFKENYKKSSL